MKLGKVYVYDGASWVDLGVVRDITVSSESVDTSPDSIGRPFQLAQNVTLEFVLMQTSDTEINAVLTENSAVDLFVTDKPNGTPGVDGVRLNKMYISSVIELNLGGEENAITIRARRRMTPSEVLALVS